MAVRTRVPRMHTHLAKSTLNINMGKIGIAINQNPSETAANPCNHFCMSIIQVKQHSMIGYGQAVCGYGSQDQGVKDVCCLILSNLQSTPNPKYQIYWCDSVIGIAINQNPSETAAKPCNHFVWMPYPCIFQKSGKLPQFSEAAVQILRGSKSVTLKMAQSHF